MSTEYIFRSSWEVAETQLVPISLPHRDLLKLAAGLPFPILAGGSESLQSGGSSEVSEIGIFYYKKIHIKPLIVL